MSRSYKKHPGGGYISRYYKKQANRYVRRTKEISDGMSYRKNDLAWMVCEYRGQSSFKRWMDRERFCWNVRRPYKEPDEKKERLIWDRWCRRK
jgi:hypothetical protein